MVPMVPMVPEAATSLLHYFEEVASDGKLDRTRGKIQKIRGKNKSERGKALDEKILQIKINRPSAITKKKTEKIRLPLLPSWWARRSEQRVPDSQKIRKETRKRKIRRKIKRDENLGSKRRQRSLTLGMHTKNQKSCEKRKQQSVLATFSARTASVEENVLNWSAPQSWCRSQRPPS